MRMVRKMENEGNEDMLELRRCPISATIEIDEKTGAMRFIVQECGTFKCAWFYKEGGECAIWCIAHLFSYWAKRNI